MERPRWRPMLFGVLLELHQEKCQSHNDLTVTVNDAAPCHSEVICVVPCCRGEILDGSLKCH